MASSRPMAGEWQAFARAAREYDQSLTLEDYMESVTQATQRRITLASLELVRAHRPDIHYFNELLVQYRFGPHRQIRQVVPDNMIVVHDGSLAVEGSYDVPIVGVQPLCVFEYVSPGNDRMDYNESMDKYEKELKIRYYVLFNREIRELNLFRHNRRKYVSVRPSRNGRLAMPEIDLEIGLVDDWIRFWHLGQLLPLPAELQQSLTQARQLISSLTRQRDESVRRLSEAEEEINRLRQELDRLQGR